MEADALISENQAQRTLALAAIELGSRRSFLHVAYRVGRNNRAARSLLREFPCQSEALEQVQKWARHAENWYSKGKITSQIPSFTKPVSSQKMLMAARRAIEELGSDADRHALLLRAQEIWLTETTDKCTHCLRKYPK